MSVTVKAYLLGRDEAVKEVRRFAVDQDVSSNFEYLSRKTAGIFSNLKNNGFSMFYKGKPRINNPDMIYDVSYRGKFQIDNPDMT